jgi:hypothetical protein
MKTKGKPRMTRMNADKRETEDKDRIDALFTLPPFSLAFSFLIRVIREIRGGISYSVAGCIAGARCTFLGDAPQGCISLPLMHPSKT